MKNTIVRVGADFSAITKQTKKATASMRNMERGVTQSCSGMKAAAAGLDRALGLVGLGLSFGALAAAAKDAKEAADAQAGAEAKLARVMHNVMGATQAEIRSVKDLTAAQQALGVVGDEVQLAGAQELGTYLSKAESLRTLIPVMNDMLVQQHGFNASQEEAVTIGTMLGKVISGQTGALSRYGYYFTDAQKRVLQFGTEEERVATLARIVESNVGGMNAALASTPTGQLQQAKNTLGDIKETLGDTVNTLLVIALPLLNAINTGLGYAANLLRRVANSMAHVFGGGKSGSGPVVTYVGAAVDGLEEVETAAGAAGRAVKDTLDLLSFDEIIRLRDASSSGSGGGSAGSALPASLGLGPALEEAEEAGEGIGWLEEALRKLRDTALRVGDDFRGTFGRIKKASQEGRDGVKNDWWRLPGWFHGGFAVPVEAMSGEMWAAVAVQSRAALADHKTAWGGLADWARANVSAPLDLLRGELWAKGKTQSRAALADRKTSWGSLKDWARANVSAPLDLLRGELWAKGKNQSRAALTDRKTSWGGLKDWAKSSVTGPIGALTEGMWAQGKADSQAAIADRKATWGGVKDWARANVTDPIGAQTEGMWAKARADSRAALADHKTAWGGLKDWVKANVTDPVGELFGDMWAQAKADSKAGLKQVVENAAKLPGLISEKLSGLKDALSQGSGSGVEIIRPPVSPGGLAGGGGLPLPLLLPGLASGGVVREPTVAQIGESGPEAVVPLSQDAGWLDALAERLERRGTGWGGSLTIPVYVGGRKVTETVIRDVNEIIRSTGECPIHI